MKLRPIALTAAVLAAAVALAGCSGGGEPTEPQGDPVAGGTLTWAIPIQPGAGGLDPMVGTSLAANVIMDQAYETLLTRDADGEIQPGLAESWEQPDDLTLVLQIREGVKFADGSEFTADDVVYTFETYQTAQTSKKAYLVNVESVEASGDNEVTFHFSQPDGTFLNAISLRETFMVVGREGYGNATEDERQTRTFGTGPFQTVDWQDGVSLTAEKNEYYWADEKPYIDEIVFELIPDESARLAALQQGTVQAAYFTDGTVADQAVQSGYTLGEPPYTQGVQIFINPESGPLADVRVRQALSLSLDRQAIVDTAMLGYGAISIIPPAGDPTAPEIGDDMPNYTRDVEAARELLEEAGQPNPRIELAYFGDLAASQHPIYELMQQQAAEAGIELVLKAKPFAEIAPTFTAGESWTDLVSIPGYIRADPAFYFDAFLSEKGALNRWRDNPDADRARELLAEARATVDPEAKADLVEQLAAETAEQVLLLVPVAVPAYFEVWDATKLQGYESDPYNSRYHLPGSWLAQ